MAIEQSDVSKNILVYVVRRKKVDPSSGDNINMPRGDTGCGQCKKKKADAIRPEDSMS